MCTWSQIVSWWEIMQRFRPDVIALISHTAGTHHRSVNERGEIVSDNPLPESAQGLADVFEPLVAYLKGFGLKASAASMEKIVRIVRLSGSTQRDFKETMHELQGRLEDEMKGEFYFSLTPAEADKFEKWESGWEQILARFPTAIRDVEEMNKCFALARYTASMFHALHVAEWGAIALGDFIGVTDPRKGWGPTERKLRELIKGGHTNLPLPLAEKFEFLEQMNREIDSMVLAWRHKVDHAANHLAILPSADFTPDIAEHIIGAVRVFMLRLKEGIT